MLRLAKFALVIQAEGRVRHTGGWRKPAQELVDVFHLRNPPGTHKRTRHDVRESRARQCIEESHFGVHGNVCALNLHPLAHSLFNNRHAGKVR